jgi:hypothetical protein
MFGIRQFPGFKLDRLSVDDNLRHIPLYPLLAY